MTGAHPLPLGRGMARRASPKSLILAETAAELSASVLATHNTCDNDRYRQGEPSFVGFNVFGEPLRYYHSREEHARSLVFKFANSVNRKRLYLDLHVCTGVCTGTCT